MHATVCYGVIRSRCYLSVVDRSSVLIIVESVSAGAGASQAKPNLKHTYKGTTAKRVKQRYKPSSSSKSLSSTNSARASHDRNHPDKSILMSRPTTLPDNFPGVFLRMSDSLKSNIAPKRLEIDANSVVNARLRFCTPPVLYSLPGSGNTWVRFLIDRVLSLPSGSLYNDTELLTFFPGEMTCQHNMSVIKAHPDHFPYRILFDRYTAAFPGKCTRRGIYKFDSMILLLRDPLRSIWAEYQRTTLQGMHDGNSHASVIPLSKFNRSDFEHFSVWYAAGVIRRTFQHSYASAVQMIPPQNRITIYYEDLQSKATQKKTLRAILRFLSRASFSDEILSEAFNSSEALHRTKRDENATQDLKTTFEVAFTPELSKKVWKILWDALHGFRYRNSFKE